jgi:hypothetical protein
VEPDPKRYQKEILKILYEIVFPPIVFVQLVLFGKPLQIPVTKWGIP